MGGGTSLAPVLRRDDLLNNAKLPQFILRLL